MIDLRPILSDAKEKNASPAVIAYNRIDGPGSSLDLPVFQQAFWRLPEDYADAASDPAEAWTKNLPRTIGFTINLGTRIDALPFESGRIAVHSVDYETEVEVRAGQVLPVKQNWLVKILDVFNLSGVKLVCRNLRPGVLSAGLGGSATVTTGVVLLANELAGRPFSAAQMVALASRMEQDLGVSLTGTQEQANVVYGGVTDYCWFPWGLPGQADTGYGACLRFPLVDEAHYGEVEEHMAIFHSGRARASSDVNAVWIDALSSAEGYHLLITTTELAYQFREAIRLRNWRAAVAATRAYQQVRTKLCAKYMEGAAEIFKHAEQHDCAAFPLGGGGGGAVLVITAEPAGLESVRRDLGKSVREIPFKILACGHELINLPL